jgi:hypothetical protein
MDNIDPKFKELAQFVMDQTWQMQARLNVLETVVQQLAISLAKQTENPRAFLDDFMSILQNAGQIATTNDPAAGQQLIQLTKEHMTRLLKDLDRNGKKIGGANDNTG